MDGRHTAWVREHIAPPFRRLYPRARASRASLSGRRCTSDGTRRQEPRSAEERPLEVLLQMVLTVFSEFRARESAASPLMHTRLRLQPDIPSLE